MSKSKKFTVLKKQDSADCHKGTVDLPEIVVSEGKSLILSGGGHSRGVDFTETDMIFDLARSARSSAVKGNAAAIGNPLLTKVLAGGIPEIEINWPDYGVPTLDINFWEDLATALREFTTASRWPFVRVTFCCQGGHGRTGTALAIISHMLGLVPDKMSPVAYIRDMYCKQAIESDSQIKYVGAMCGMKLTDTSRSWSRSVTPTLLSPSGMNTVQAGTQPFSINYGPNKGLWYFNCNWYATFQDAKKEINKVPTRVDLGKSAEKTQPPLKVLHSVKSGTSIEIADLMNNNDFSASFVPDWELEFWPSCICPKCLAWRQHLDRESEKEHDKVQGAVGWSKKTADDLKDRARDHYSAKGNAAAIDLIEKYDYSQYYMPGWAKDYIRGCTCNVCLAWAQRIRTLGVDLDAHIKQVVKATKSTKKATGSPAPSLTGGQDISSRIKVTCSTSRINRAAVFTELTQTLLDADLDSSDSVSEAGIDTDTLAGLYARRIGE